MKQLRKLKDGSRFRLYKKSKVIYTLQNRLKGADKDYCYITSENSRRTFCKFLGRMVWPE